MDRPKVLPGDRFGVCSESFLSDAINKAQTFWAADGNARYTHLGLIATEWEDTLEALSTYRLGHLCEYFNHSLIIFRDETYSLRRRMEVLDGLIDKYQGRRYPVRQLLAHLFPPLARATLWPPVCSEIVSLYEYKLGEVDWWRGVNPDTKVDEWRLRSRLGGRAHIIYEGRWLWDGRLETVDQADRGDGPGNHRNRGPVEG